VTSIRDGGFSRLRPKKQRIPPTGRTRATPEQQEIMKLERKIAQAESEGLDKIFLDAGFEWRDPGCSMCLAMNADRLEPDERCASTSNRNFEGRQGQGGRTHLLSPAMAAAAAIEGHITNVTKYYEN